MGNVTTEQDEDVLTSLRAHAASIAERSHIPYSNRSIGVALLLSDGCIVPGVRVESASFSLLIPATLNAITTAVAVGRTDIMAGAMNRPLRPWDRSYLEGHFEESVNVIAEDAFVCDNRAEMPTVSHPVSPYLDRKLPNSDKQAIRLTRNVAEQAYVPESSFKVGCVALLKDGRLVSGVNVEHPDWSSILCAERNVLGTCHSYGLDQPVALYLSCPDDDHGSPCGACRQLLTELAPTAKLCMDRGDAPPESVVPSALLPGSFSGESIRSRL